MKPLVLFFCFAAVYLAGQLDPRPSVQAEYERVLAVANDLGTSRFRYFNQSFGHEDTHPGSHLFSLRLRPAITVHPSGQIKYTRPDLRAILCKTADGLIHILQFYQKESYVSEELFSKSEKLRYEQARLSAKRQGLYCLKSVP